MRDTTQEFYIVRSPGTPLPVRLQFKLLIRWGMYSEACILSEKWSDSECRKEESHGNYQSLNPNFAMC